ncbi:MAG: response regulator transcription factor [Candidatus Methylomirabilales bacterium]
MKQGRVLVADRHQNMLEGIRGLLETMFEAVVMVADEQSLLEAAEKLKPDLVVVDLSMPVSEEVNVARRLKTRYPELKLIILSVHDEPTVVKETLATGALGFVLKRSAATDLIPAVEEVRQGRTYVSPATKPPSTPQEPRKTS